jgi:hypothetical protein
MAIELSTTSYMQHPGNYMSLQDFVHRTPGETIAWQFLAFVSGVTDETCYMGAGIGWRPYDYYGGGEDYFSGLVNTQNVVDFPALTPTTETLPLEDFRKFSGSVVVSEACPVTPGATFFDLLIFIRTRVGVEESVLDAANLYVTNVMIEGGSDVEDYADGDSNPAEPDENPRWGWVGHIGNDRAMWQPQPHGSASYYPAPFQECERTD